MSLLSIFNRHPRADLSAHLDGELTPEQTRRLEAHLQTCEACAAHMETLLEARTVMRSLLEVQAPRSFTLTPEMARQARPAKAAPVRRVQPLVNGLRMTSAGLAVALAVVVVVAVGGGGTSSDDSGTSVTNLTSNSLESAPTISTAYDSAAGGVGSTAVPAAAGEDSGASPQKSEDTPIASRGPGGVSAPDSGLGTTESPEPPVATTDGSAYQGQTDDGFGRNSATDVPKAVVGAVGSTTPAPEAAQVATDNSSGGGIGTLTIVAIVLGVLLAGALIGSIAASRFARDTR